MEQEWHNSQHIKKLPICQCKEWPGHRACCFDHLFILFNFGKLVVVSFFIVLLNIGLPLMMFIVRFLIKIFITNVIIIFLPTKPRSIENGLCKNDAKCKFLCHTFASFWATKLINAYFKLVFHSGVFGYFAQLGFWSVAFAGCLLRCHGYLLFFIHF